MSSFFAQKVILSAIIAAAAWQWIRTVVVLWCFFFVQLWLCVTADQCYERLRLQILSFYGPQVIPSSRLGLGLFPAIVTSQYLATASRSAIALKIDPVQKIRIYDVWSPSDVKRAFLFVYFLPSVQPLFENFGFEDLLVSTLGASFTATKLKLFSSSLWNLPIFLIWNFYPFWFRIDYFSSCLKKELICFRIFFLNGWNFLSNSSSSFLPKRFGTKFFNKIFSVPQS